MHSEAFLPLVCLHSCHSVHKLWLPHSTGHIKDLNYQMSVVIECVRKIRGNTVYFLNQNMDVSFKNVILIGVSEVLRLNPVLALIIQTVKNNYNMVVRR